MLSHDMNLHFQMFLQKELPAMVFITDAQERASDLFFLNTSATTFFINDQEKKTHSSMSGLNIKTPWNSNNWTMLLPIKDSARNQS